MRRPRRRQMHYLASTLRDGTVLASHPIRKPAPKVMKRDHLRIDEDGVTIEHSSGGQELTHAENRFRFQDLIAARLNTRRAIRELVLPVFAELRREIKLLRAEVGQLKATLSLGHGGVTRARPSRCIPITERKRDAVSECRTC